MWIRATLAIGLLFAGACGSARDAVGSGDATGQGEGGAASMGLVGASGSVSDVPSGLDGSYDAGMDLDVRSADTASAAPPGPEDPARYPAGAVHAPITTKVLARMRAIIASGQRKTSRFLKVGDANCGYEMTPFDPANMFHFQPVPAVPEGLSGTVSYFSSDKINGESSFLRYSLACPESGTAEGVLAPAPSLLDREVGVTDAAFAMVMLGGLEMWGKNFDSLRHEMDAVHGFAPAMLDVVDALIANGVVPVVRAFPNRVNCPGCIDENAPASCTCAPGSAWQVTNQATLFETIVRGIAEARQVPFADDNVLLEQEGSRPGDYLEGDSGHLKVASGGNPADFRDMKLGYPVDNLILLEQLERLRRSATGSYTADQNPGPARRGDGNGTHPYVIDTLPFTDLRSFTDASASPIVDYSSCHGPNAVRSAYFYRLDISTPTPVRVVAFARAKSPVHLMLRHFTGDIDIARCSFSSDAAQPFYDDAYAATLRAGVHFFTVATPSFAANGTPPEVMLIVQPCGEGDPRCR
jgi:hypothetical protein